MSFELFRKVNKKSDDELKLVAPKIKSLTFKLLDYIEDSFKFIREILIRISKITGPFWVHIHSPILEDARHEIAGVLLFINSYLFSRVENWEIAKEWGTYVLEDTIEELHYVIGGRIRGIVPRVRAEWRNIKNEAIREKVRAGVNYVVHVLVELLTDLRKGEKELASLFVKNL